VSQYQKGKTNMDLLKQETVSGSGIRSRQITMPAPHHSVFTSRMPFLPPNQQRQPTEGSKPYKNEWFEPVKELFGVWTRVGLRSSILGKAHNPP